MQILSRLILHLLRCPNVATSPATMHRLSSPSRPLFAFMASAPPRWWPPALARQVFTLMAASNPPVRRVSRFPHGSRNMTSSSGVKGELGRPDRRLLIPSTNVTMISLGVHTTKEFIARYGDGRPAHGEEDERRSTVDVISGDEHDMEVIDGKRDTTGEIVDTTGCKLSSDDEEAAYPMDILPMSSHRDGSVYMDTHIWKRDYCIADRNETRLEAMTLSAPTNYECHNGNCFVHTPTWMLQIFSLKLAKIPLKSRTIKLYGYVAVRDELDPLLNYVVNFSRDDPVIVEQGSIINIAGPKRGIDLLGAVLLEYDMRIKTAEQEKDDLQLIDGLSVIDHMDIWKYDIFSLRIQGDCGAIDITGSCLENAVEATVEVLISKVQSSFNLCLGCFSSGLHAEIRLFDGAIGESRGLKRSVVAVVMGTGMDLKFKVDTDSFIHVEHCCSFKANEHGRATQEINIDFALISVTVTWSTLPQGF